MTLFGSSSTPNGTLFLKAKPIEINVPKITAVGGVRITVLADEVVVSSHSQLHKAMESAVSTEMAYPQADVEIESIQRYRVEAKEFEPVEYDPDWIQLLVRTKPAGKPAGDFLHPESHLNGGFAAGDMWRITTPGVFAEPGGTFRSEKQAGTFEYEIMHADGVTQGTHTYAL